jgi:UTP--glucose-1-phosphate uridylyltransferase
MRSSHIRTVIIPVAGLGTRMLPATKAIPKEMLPLGHKPLIQYIVEEAVAAGFTKIIFVTHSSKNAIENHFDSAYELESILSKREKSALLNSVVGIIPEDVQIISVRQGQALGLGHAVLSARSAVGDCDFAVMLPDVLMEPGSYDHRIQNLREMVMNFERTSRSQVMVETVPVSMVNQYGIVDMGEAIIAPGGTTPILDMVEKPDIGSEPSNYAIVGRYVFSRDIWSHLEQVRPGCQGEIQLTDAILALAKSKASVDAYAIHGRSMDCGSREGYAQAFIKTVLQDPEIGERILQFTRSLTRNN